MVSVIDELEIAIRHYATDKVKTEIVDFSIWSGHDEYKLDTNERFTFRVKVTNQGSLDMKNVVVQVKGSAWAEVAYPVTATEFGLTAIAPRVDVPANAEPVCTKYFMGKALKHTPTAGADIVTANILSWDASLEHLLTDCSGQGAPEGVLHTTISKD